MQGHRYIFVGGLHRSGTSLLARLIAGIPGVAAIRGAPVPEDEGVYLQGAIPHTALHGAPMHFATDPAQHLVEGCLHDRLEVRHRLEADWAPHFGPGRWRVEKSPVNLTRMRLYQQLFPLSQFVVVMRHPEAVAAATSKWVAQSPAAMMRHWLEAHEQLARDLPYLHCVMVLRYEDIVAAPGQALARLAAFLGEPPAPLRSEIRDGNAAYRGCARLAPDMAARALDWGYRPGLGTEPRPPLVRHMLRSIREAALAPPGAGPGPRDAGLPPFPRPRQEAP
ncbi:sulfotransferase family protein [Mangrovicoccus algicola]|uniref:Sulfotransferase n=1 Tax=Mangrovicoccus algicola TaxID=2771008 RepID=A0A8J6ZEQ2_9RHOB|nr:sulfotransferase [Mangrovicoccus algicola]MBE3640286.1 sulfotransferase [Mangrovicoccus algicola]